MVARSKRKPNIAEQSKLRAVERYRQALELRRAGAPYSQIAETLGYASPATAKNAVEQGIKEYLSEPAEDVLNLELARLDAMLTTLWPRFRQGDLSAGDRILRIMDRRARYMGLDAPEKHEINASVHGEVEHRHVVMIEGDENEYLKALEDARIAIEGVQQALPDPNVTREFDAVPTDHIEDAEIVEDIKEDESQARLNSPESG